MYAIMYVLIPYKHMCLSFWVYQALMSEEMQQHMSKTHLLHLPETQNSQTPHNVETLLPEICLMAFDPDSALAYAFRLFRNACCLLYKHSNRFDKLRYSYNEMYNHHGFSVQAKSLSFMKAVRNLLDKHVCDVNVHMTRKMRGFLDILEKEFPNDWLNPCFGISGLGFSFSIDFQSDDATEYARHERPLFYDYLFPRQRDVHQISVCMVVVKRVDSLHSTFVVTFTTAPKDPGSTTFDAYAALMANAIVQYVAPFAMDMFDR